MIRQQTLEQRVGSFVMEHPKTMAAIAGTATLLALPLYYLDASPHMIQAGAPAYFTYLGISAVSDYHERHRYVIKKRASSSIQRCKRLLIDHIPAWSILGGAAAATYVYYLGKSKGDFFHPDGIPFTPKEFAATIAFPACTMLSHLSLSLLHNADRVRQSFSKMSQCRSKGEKIWNAPWEHPYVPGVMMAVYEGITQFQPEFDKPLHIALLIPRAIQYTFLAVMAGGLFHSSSMRYYHDAFRASILAARGKKKKAAEQYKKTLHIPSSAAMTLERKLKLASLLLDAGEEREASTQYKEAASLFASPDSEALSSPDLLQKMLFVHRSHFTNRFCRIAESMNEVVEYAPSRRARQSFVFKRGVNKESIEREYRLNIAIARVIGKEGPSPPSSVVFFHGSDGKAYHVMMRKNVHSLEEAVNAIMKKYGYAQDEVERQSYPLIAAAMDSLASLHIRMTNSLTQKDGAYYLMYEDEEGVHNIHLHVRDYRQEFFQRVIQGKPYDTHPRFGPPGYKRGKLKAVDRFIDHALEYAARLNKRRSFFVHGDVAPRHLLLDNTLLDFESAAIGNQWIDVAGCYMGLPFNQHRLAEKFFPSYHEKINPVCSLKQEEAKDMMCDSLVHTALCVTGTSAGRMKPRYKDDGKIDMFINNMNKLIEMYNDFSLIDFKEDFIRMLPHSGFKHSKSIDYCKMMKKLRKNI